MADPAREKAGPALRALGVGRRRPDRGGWLLRDASLSLSAGERVALVGPTGAGKTLLLRALALLDPLDAGQVLWQGRPIPAGEVPRFRSRVMYLPQRPALFGGTVLEDLQEPYRLEVHRHKQLSRSRLSRLLRQVGRDDSFLGKTCRDLSGGERQLTALLRAVQLDPQVLLLDEPTAALDAAAARAVEDLLRDWQEEEEGRAFVWVGHQLDQVGRVAGRIVKMRDGMLTAE